MRRIVFVSPLIEAACAGRDWKRNIKNTGAMTKNDVKGEGNEYLIFLQWFLKTLPPL
jgi:hypothetical protein